MTPAPQFEWLATALPRRTVALRMRAADALVLPPMHRPFAALVLAFDPTLQRSSAEALERALLDAGADLAPEAGGPGVAAWEGEPLARGLKWMLEPARVIDLFFGALSRRIAVTTFLVVVLDADDDAWQRALAATRQALKRPDSRLHSAAAGRVDEVRLAISSGWPIDEFEADLAETPLTFAAREEQLEIARLLLAAGADVNKHCEERIGETPLGCVAGKCSLAMARLLVHAGADPTIPGWMQITALQRAAERDDEVGRQVFALLRDGPRARSAILELAAQILAAPTDLVRRCRQLCSLLPRLQLDLAPAAADTLTLLDSEADRWPVDVAPELLDPEYHRRSLAELRAFEAASWPDARAACRSLLQQLAALPHGPEDAP